MNDMTDRVKPMKHMMTPQSDYDMWADAPIGELVASGGAKAEIRVSRMVNTLALDFLTAASVLAFACYDAAGYFVGRYVSVKSARMNGWGAAE